MKENHMNKRQKLIPLNKLNLTDRFLFEEVMEDVFGTPWPTRRRSASS